MGRSTPRKRTTSAAGVRTPAKSPSAADLFDMDDNDDVADDEEDIGTIVDADMGPAPEPSPTPAIETASDSSGESAEEAKEDDIPAPKRREGPSRWLKNELGGDLALWSSLVHGSR